MQYPTDETAVIPGRLYSKDIKALTHINRSDEELVMGFVRNQDERSFNEIVNRYGDKIYNLALRITHNHSDAEEVLQEVFITLINKADTFRGESKFSSWLYRVTTNVSYIYLRDEKKYKSDASLEDYTTYDESGTLDGIQINDWSDRPDEEIQSHEGMKIIEKTVNELPLAYRTVFHLRDVEGLSNEEVARVLGLSITNVKSRIHRARLFLRDKLSDYFYEWKK
jgi:RNA polymerase sigma-70 factor (ECF subfamily)